MEVGTEVNSILPLLAVMVSAAVVPILASSRSANVREAWTFVAAFGKVGIVLAMLPHVLRGDKLSFEIAPVFPGVSLAFRVDAMGELFALVSSFLWIVTSAYSIGYMRGLKEHGQTRYYCYFALAMSSTMGVAFSANLLTLYVFYELLSFATYPLVTHHQDEEGRSAGRRYLTYIVGGSIGLVLPAMLVCYGSSQTLDFTPGGILANSGLSRFELGLLLFMFVFGFAKAAIMPFHSWLPAAMVAPTPVSALLHAVAVVKVGVFSILRVLVGIMGFELLSGQALGGILILVASVTIVGASLVALCQDGLKKMLAYSTVGQLSYIVLGASLLSENGLSGGLIHIATHAFGKITLFFCAGAIYVATGKQNISELNGIGRRMPLTMASFLIASMSIIGVPPTAGFLSKWLLITASVDSGRLEGLFVLLLSSLLSAGYLIPVVYRAFFLPQPEGEPTSVVAEWRSPCSIAAMVTSFGCLLMFLSPGLLLGLARKAAELYLGV
jgi:multicomponent Na+:H+ antiporter subunit D